MAEKIVNVNVAAQVKRVAANSEGYVRWSDDDIAKFEACWVSGTLQRLALTLLVYTVQRPGDVILMGYQNLRETAISVGEKAGGPLEAKRDPPFALALIRKSTANPVWVPIHPALQRELDQLPKDRAIFLLTPKGRPFTQHSFGTFFREAVKWAGLPPGRTPLGLRKEAACRLAEVGCSNSEIMAITGWKSEKTLWRCTAEANQRRLARAAMKKLMLAEEGEESSNVASFPAAKPPARRQAEAGCSDSEIMIAFGGWKSEQEVLRYTATPRRKTNPGRPGRGGLPSAS